MKNNNLKQKKIIAVNNLLKKIFGIPPRPKKLPNPVDMLIATILSQNTNDKNSFRAFSNLKNEFSSWDELGYTNRSKIEKIIKVAGLGKQKSAAIKNFISQNIEENGKTSLSYLKKMDEDEAMNKLTTYKGVGVKTASCVLLFSLGKNICPVDTHVHRTVNRIGIVKASTPDKTFDLLNHNFPPKIAHQFHTNLIRLGREICKPQKPNCSICPIEKECNFTHKIFTEMKRSKANSFMLLDNV